MDIEYDTLREIAEENSDYQDILESEAIRFMSKESKTEQLLEEFSGIVKSPHGWKIPLESYLEASSNDSKMDLIIKNSVEVTSVSMPEIADIINKTIARTRQIYKHHKSDNNKKALMIAQKAKSLKAKETAIKLVEQIDEIINKYNLKNDNQAAKLLTQLKIETPKGKTNWQMATIQRLRRNATMIIPD